jgi:splicing factor U2AF 35 kDa subunit
LGDQRSGNWRERQLGGSSGGAAHLARIHGTEEDRVNCPFYFKIGACRHGDRCSRQHHKPPFSQTILIKHMWTNPQTQMAAMGGDIASMDKEQLQDNFDDFYEEVCWLLLFFVFFYFHHPIQYYVFYSSMCVRVCA